MASPAAVAPLLATVASGGASCFAAVTVAGVVPAPPERVFPMLSDPTRAGHGVFSDVKSAREVGRSLPRRSSSGALCQQVDIEQVARVQVLRLPVDAAMTVRLAVDHTAKQVRLRLLRGNLLMRRYEGFYAVLPCSGDPAHLPALPDGLAEALGPEACRQLAASLAQHHQKQQQPKQQPKQPSVQQQLACGRGPGGRRGQPSQHSLVILHQRLQPALRPPPGLGGYVRGQVRRQFERMFADLHRAASSLHAAPRTALQDFGDLVRSFPLPCLSL